MSKNDNDGNSFQKGKNSVKILNYKPEKLIGKTIKNAEYSSSLESYLIIEFTDNSAILIDAEYSEPLDIEYSDNPKDWEDWKSWE